MNYLSSQPTSVHPYLFSTVSRQADRPAYLPMRKMNHE